MGLETKKQQERQHQYDVDMFEREATFNAQQAQQAYNREREFYDYQFEKESEYNSPAAQMQRYKAAGLNPYMMQFGDGSTSVSAASSPSASASGSNTVNTAAFQNNSIQALTGIANIAQNMAALSSQMDLNSSQQEVNIANAAKTRGVDTDKARQDIELSKEQQSTLKSQQKLNSSQAKSVDATTKETLYRLENILPKSEKELIARIQQIYNDIDISQGTSKAQIAKLYQDVAESIQRADLYGKQAAQVQQQLDTFRERFENEMNLSTEQFQQMQTQNARMKIEGDIMQRLMNPRNGTETVQGVSDFVKLMFLSVLGKLH